MTGVRFASQWYRRPDMFDRCDEPGAATEMVTYGDRQESAPLCAGLAWQPDRVTGVDIRSLPAGTKVVVTTRNSRYRFVTLDGSGGNALVEGGSYFPQATTVRVEGSSLGKSLLKVGWIGLGLFLKLSCGGKQVITSHVRSIRIQKES